MIMRLAALGVLGAVLLGGCGDDEGGDVDDADAVLTQQRLDVRRGASELLDHAERRLAGTTTQSGGRYEGCESTFNDQYRTFRYLAQARVDTGRPVDADALAGVLDDAGFPAGEATPGPGGRRTLTGERDGVTASLAVIADDPWVLVDVAGPCVEVPEDERDDWLRKDEPTPDLR